MADFHDIFEEGDLQRRLRLLIADRHSADAARFFQLLMVYVHRRTAAVSRRCGNGLTQSEQEEVVADVILQLMQGALPSFRGQTVPELYAFVRTIADRTTWRVIRRKEREADTLKGEGAEVVEGWMASVPRPDARAERVPDSPLPEKDQAYLIELLKAGSKAELARQAGVSRAAVTQRVQRIRLKVAQLGAQERMAHDVWLSRAARRVVQEQHEPV